MFLAGASVPYSFQRTLMHRNDLDQALATGIIMALEYAIGALVQDGVEVVAFHLSGAREATDEVKNHHWRQYAMLLDLAAIGMGLALQAALKQREGENMGRAATRTAGAWITTGAFAGLVTGAIQEAAEDLDLHRLRSFPYALPGGVLLAVLLDERRHRAERAAGPSDISRLRKVDALGLACLVSLALAGISTVEKVAARSVAHAVSRFLPGPERLWRPLGHAAAIAGMGRGIGEVMKGVYHSIEQMEARVEPAFDAPPLSAAVSGGPGSLIPWDTLSKQGRRYVSTYLRTEWIEYVMGEPPAADPIRVFVGLDSAPTEEERVELAMRELERTGAFDRSLLMVISPTGTGYVNYVAVEAAEYMTRGDITSVSHQYSKRPSVLSLDTVPEGREQYRMLLEAIHARLAQRPQARRPRVVLFGESLGAWTSEAAFDDEGTEGMLALGVDRGLWIGTPYATKWKDQVLGPPRPDVDRSLVGAFNDFGEVEAMDPDERARLRYVMITHYNDAVAHFNSSLLFQRPDWLGDPARRPPTVPATEVYGSPTTFILTLVDLKNAANVVPGRFEAQGHDYRKDLARFVREVYALDVTDEQLDHIESALRESETWRSEWIEAKDKPKKAGKAEKRKEEGGRHGKVTEGAGEPRDKAENAGAAGKKQPRKPAGGGAEKGGEEKDEDG